MCPSLAHFFPKKSQRLAIKEPTLLRNRCSDYLLLHERVPLGRSHPSPQLLTCLSSLPPFFCFSLLASPPIYQGHPHFKTFDLADSSVRNSLSIDVFMTSSFTWFKSLLSCYLLRACFFPGQPREKFTDTHKYPDLFFFKVTHYYL